MMMAAKAANCLCLISFAFGYSRSRGRVFSWDRCSAHSVHERTRHDIFCASRLDHISLILSWLVHVENVVAMPEGHARATHGRRLCL
eukprot:scaffold281601_cov27-Tisochrysis_lutea.AAC.2